MDKTSFMCNEHVEDAVIRNFKIIWWSDKKYLFKLL